MPLRNARPEIVEAFEHAWVSYLNSGSQCSQTSPAARSFIAQRILERASDGEDHPLLLGNAAAADALIECALREQSRVSAT